MPGIAAVQDAILKVIQPLITTHYTCLNTKNPIYVELQVWKNQISVLERLIEAGCQIDVQDKESGW
jgi:hypothetical protein